MSSLFRPKVNEEGILPRLENVCCDLCGNSNTRIICTNYDRIHNVYGRYNIVRCNYCGLIYVNPRPTLESIVSYYPNNYGPYLQTSNSSQINGYNSIKSVLKKIYNLLSLKPLLDRIEVKNTILPSIYKVNQRTRLLDIGCATGNFLKKCSDKFGCEVYGVEIDKGAADYAREHNDVNVYNGDFLASNFPDNFFDIITMWWFLEHTHSPTEVLKETWRILKKTGGVVIGVPNGASIGRYLFHNKWYGYDTPRHLYVFSPKTINLLLQKTGFELIDIKHDYSTWDLMGSLQYLLFGEKYLPGKRIGNIQGNRIVQLFMMPLGLLQGVLKISGTMVVYARKRTKFGRPQ